MAKLAVSPAATAATQLLLLLLLGGGTQARQQHQQHHGGRTSVSSSIPPLSSAHTVNRRKTEENEKAEIPTLSPTTTTTDTDTTLSPSVLATYATTASASSFATTTHKPSYEKAIPLTGPIQCKSLVASQEDEEDTITPPILDGIADEWTNVTVYELPLISNLDPTISYPHGNGAVQMQCVYDAEKVYFVFHVPGMYAAGGEDNVQMNAAISTIFKIGQEASLSNMVSSTNLGWREKRSDDETENIMCVFLMMVGCVCFLSLICDIG